MPPSALDRVCMKNDVREEQNLNEIKVILCWNYEPRLIDVEAEHVDGDMFLQNRHP